MENLENTSNEQDPTFSMREDLIDMLPARTRTDDVFFIEQFRKGVFFVPSETVSHIMGLMGEISDEEKRTRAQKLMSEILKKS